MSASCSRSRNNSRFGTSATGELNDEKRAYNGTYVRLHVLEIHHYLEKMLASMRVDFWDERAYQNDQFEVAEVSQGLLQLSAHQPLRSLSTRLSNLC